MRLGISACSAFVRVCRGREIWCYWWGFLLGGGGDSCPLQPLQSWSEVFLCPVLTASSVYAPSLPGTGGLTAIRFFACVVRPGSVWVGIPFRNKYGRGTDPPTPLRKFHLISPNKVAKNVQKQCVRMSRFLQLNTLCMQHLRQSLSNVVVMD